VSWRLTKKEGRKKKWSKRRKKERKKEWHHINYKEITNDTVSDCSRVVAACLPGEDSLRKEEVKLMGNGLLWVSRRADYKARSSCNILTNQVPIPQKEHCTSVTKEIV
jgi:hypothetical protein